MKSFNLTLTAAADSPPVSLISETDDESIEPVEIEYPYPVLSTEDITNSPEWKEQENE
mgnify:CR=1 FL=1